ncbi:hypothetical protein IscW_ISCW002280 [Ixodes scapularis]|uniref:Uncharacterized protein n=1 Tax=Ixodes scapularis TaxID=6945 RepID=B7P9E7_IXOSC|nr:hypothetical protein IscW_ISCW002280 [Ixodes scapularis]|eukprot:XP_002404069.1 hypothetical protein IscW_ISCW002280 [Ixodes scapularis]
MTITCEVRYFKLKAESQRPRRNSLTICIPPNREEISAVPALVDIRTCKLSYLSSFRAVFNSDECITDMSQVADVGCESVATHWKCNSRSDMRKFVFNQKIRSNKIKKKRI